MHVISKLHAPKHPMFRINCKVGCISKLYCVFVYCITFVTWSLQCMNLPSALHTCSLFSYLVLGNGSDKYGNWLVWASCQIRKIAGAHAPAMPGTFSPSPRVSDPDMHHDTCVTHVSWFMQGSLTRFPLKSTAGENGPGIPGACATCNFTYLVRSPWHIRCASGEPCARAHLCSTFKAISITYMSDLPI